MSISISIDVTQIRKERIREFKRHDGTKGRSLDLILLDSKNDKYGNHYFIKQASTAEERDAGLELPILGNAKDWSRVDNQQQPQPQPQAQQQVQPSFEDDDIPF
tara:strand:- start:530 stop:841 length:312 start_codon:yes stop_codon:yes gene_type:complete